MIGVSVSVSSPERKRQVLEKHLAQLYAQYEAAYLQLGRTLSDADKVKIEEEVAHIEQEIEKAEAKLRDLELAHGPRSRRHLDWTTHLPKINFSEAVEIFERIVERLDLEEGGAAFFLLQDCHSMGGKWCVARLKEMLDTSDFRYYPIEFSPEARLDERGLLSRLGQYLGCDPFPDEQDQELYLEAVRAYAQTVIRKICTSLQSGTVIFIELKVWDMLCLEERFLPWLLRELWVPLVRDEWPRTMEDYPLAKLFIVVSAHSAFTSGYLPPSLASTADQFDREKIVELPLRAWTPEEIRRWLLKFSGLTDPQIGIKSPEIKQMAKLIHEASGNGQPMLVYAALMDEFEKHFG